MTEFIIRFQATYNKLEGLFLPNYFLINKRGFSQLTREITKFYCLYLKEVRNINFHN